MAAPTIMTQKPCFRSIAASPPRNLSHWRGHQTHRSERRSNVLACGTILQRNAVRPGDVEAERYRSASSFCHAASGSLLNRGTGERQIKANCPAKPDSATSRQTSTPQCSVTTAPATAPRGRAP